MVTNFEEIPILKLIADVECILIEIEDEILKEIESKNILKTSRTSSRDFLTTY